MPAIYVEGMSAKAVCPYFVCAFQYPGLWGHGCKAPSGNITAHSHDTDEAPVQLAKKRCIVSHNGNYDVNNGDDHGSL